MGSEPKKRRGSLVSCHLMGLVGRAFSLTDGFAPAVAKPRAPSPAAAYIPGSRPPRARIIRASPPPLVMLFMTFCICR
jgi:hypothetical protein